MNMDGMLMSDAQAVDESAGHVPPALLSRGSPIRPAVV